MKRLAVFGLIAMLLPSVGTRALAGKASTRRVKVNLTTFLSTASGSLRSARTSSDSTQHIGCVVKGSQMTCLAVDANGVQLSCLSSLPEHLAAARSINSTSDIYFSVFTGVSMCNDVFVNNDSSNL
jgi:hypothetical protein